MKCVKSDLKSKGTDKWSIVLHSSLEKAASQMFLIDKRRQGKHAFAIKVLTFPFFGELKFALASS
ncbi:hypothetical protein STEG23_003489, partial [Scotinomys teguina]